MTDKNNVYQMRTGMALFTPSLREDVSRGLSEFTDENEKATDTLEGIISTALVGFAISIGAKIGKNLGMKAGNSVTSNVRKFK